MGNFYIALAVNFGIAILILLFYIYKKQKKKAVVCSLFVVSAPFIAPLCLACAQVYNIVFYKQRAKELSREELSMDDARTAEMVNIDIQKEADKIPIREAMLSSNMKNRRRALLEVLKSNKDQEVLSVIKEAVVDDDTEVSHYAISFVTAETTSYRKAEEEASKFLRDYPGTQSRVRYIECLCSILKSGFFTEYEQEVYILNLDEQIKILKTEDEKAVTGLMLSQIIALFEQIKAEDKVCEYLALAREMVTLDINAAKICLKCYFKKGDKEEFSALLKEIKFSTLEFDSEVLDWIRFYNSL